MTESDSRDEEQSPKKKKKEDMGDNSLREPINRNWRGEEEEDEVMEEVVVDKETERKELLENLHGRLDDAWGDNDFGANGNTIIDADEIPVINRESLQFDSRAALGEMVGTQVSEGVRMVLTARNRHRDRHQNEPRESTPEQREHQMNQLKTVGGAIAIGGLAYFMLSAYFRGKKDDESADGE